MIKLIWINKNVLFFFVLVPLLIILLFLSLFICFWTILNATLFNVWLGEKEKPIKIQMHHISVEWKQDEREPMATISLIYQFNFIEMTNIHALWNKWNFLQFFSNFYLSVGDGEFVEFFRRIITKHTQKKNKQLIFGV